MQTEIEAKFLGVSHDKLRAKLKALGATCEQPMRLMRRKNYDYSDKRLEKAHGWIRVRDEGNKVTLSYKQLQDRSLHGTKEITLTVNDFDQTCKLLEALGLQQISYQETKRESWKLDQVEVELDEWPWVPPFVELEGPDESSVRSAAKTLGLNWADSHHGSVEVAYMTVYDVTERQVDEWPEILFTPVPDWLKSKAKK